jgi:hypothetical protein
MQHSPIKTLSNLELHNKIKTLAASERQLTLVVLQHLREVEARRLFCEFGYGSLLDYCVNELKYSESSAYRRIQSMRLLKEIPEAAKNVVTGELTLTNLAKTQSVFRKLSEQSKSLDKSTKQQVLATLTNKTQKQAEEILTELHPLPAPRPMEKVLSSEKVLLRFAISAQAKKQLQEIEELSGLPHDLEKIFELMLEKTLLALRKQKGLSHRSCVNKDNDLLMSFETEQRSLDNQSSQMSTGTFEFKTLVARASLAINQKQHNAISGKSLTVTQAQSKARSGMSLAVTKEQSHVAVERRALREVGSAVFDAPVSAVASNTVVNLPAWDTDANPVASNTTVNLQAWGTDANPAASNTVVNLAVCDTAVVSLSRKAQVTKSTLGLFKNKKIAKATAVLAKTASTATDTARSTHVNITEAACLRAPHMPAENKRKYISVNVKKAVWQRADHKCEYTDPRSKRRCGQKRFLHIDHIRPIAQGGSDSFANLQLLCSAHNLWKSDR